MLTPRLFDLTDVLMVFQCWSRYICYIFHISQPKVKCFAPWLGLDNREETLTTDKVRPQVRSVAQHCRASYLCYISGLVPGVVRWCFFVLPEREVFLIVRSIDIVSVAHFILILVDRTLVTSHLLVRLQSRLYHRQE